MANGDQTSLVTNQQPIGQQQGLMTEEETVEQPKTLYETLRGVDPIQLRNQILKNRAQNLISSRLDSSDVASIMSQVNAGKLTLDQAVAHSKTMQSGTMKILNKFNFDKNMTSKKIEAYYKTHGSTMNTSEMNALSRIRNHKLRQEIASERAETVQEKRNKKNRTFHTFGQDRYFDLAQGIDISIEGMTTEEVKKNAELFKFRDALTKEIEKDMGAGGGNILSGNYHTLITSLYGLAMRIPVKNIQEQKGFILWNSDGTNEFVSIPREERSPKAIRTLWFERHKGQIIKARAELGKMNTETLPEEQSQQADPLNLFQYVE
jgi:hypothetical protein